MLPSITVLLSSVVDYAGLFPPAKLSLQEAMANYSQYHLTSQRWMLGRFVLPASRLNEFEEFLPKVFVDGMRQWQLSLILAKGELEAEIEKMQGQGIFAEEFLEKRKIAIKALEFPLLSPQEIERLSRHLPAGVDSFWEIPHDSDLTAHIAALQHIQGAAKVRTGGTTADAFLSGSQLCRYLFAFAEAQIPFKATAGLHHPLPGNYCLTYESNSPVARMQGFLNLVILTAFVYWQKVTPQEALELLDEAAINDFQFLDESLSWRNCQLNLSEIQEARQHFFQSFGSCSFQEPTADLKELHLL